MTLYTEVILEFAAVTGKILLIGTVFIAHWRQGEEKAHNEGRKVVENFKDLLLLLKNFSRVTRQKNIQFIS